NYRWIKLPPSIGVMLVSLLISLGLVGLGRLGLGSITEAGRFILGEIDFDETLMQGMLSFLLFAGALHINLEDLLARKVTIGFLATIGLLLSTFIFGSVIYFVFSAFSMKISYVYCLLFGAFISPTDPIAVLSILKSAGAGKSLEIKIAGESLFNDGIAVVVFTVLYEIAVKSAPVSFSRISTLFLMEAVGGAVCGLVLGWLTYLMLKSIDNYQVEALLTLALVMGGYAFTSALHMSGPIAIVTAGLLIGNHGRRLAMSDQTRANLDTFWELIDEILNAVLFVLIGLEVLLLTFTKDLLLVGLLGIPVILAARFISVALPISLLRFRREFSPGVIKILTWGGLRGGISVALALSLPPGRERELLLAVTYIIVAFSILCQGLSIKALVKKIFAAESAKSNKK
ncbi:MAG: sodium:proton antiporter, partial [bacterium]|nr:sodium:proton antiporter [bacterium]